MPDRSDRDGGDLMKRICRAATRHDCLRRCLDQRRCDSPRSHQGRLDICGHRDATGSRCLTRGAPRCVARYFNAHGPAMTPRGRCRIFGLNAGWYYFRLKPNGVSAPACHSCSHPAALVSWPDAILAVLKRERRARIACDQWLGGCRGASPGTFFEEATTPCPVSAGAGGWPAFDCLDSEVEAVRA